MTSIERTAYPRFKRVISAGELYGHFKPTREEVSWASQRLDVPGPRMLAVGQHPWQGPQCGDHRGAGVGAAPRHCLGQQLDEPPHRGEPVRQLRPPRQVGVVLLGRWDFPA